MNRVTQLAVTTCMYQRRTLEVDSYLTHAQCYLIANNHDDARLPSRGLRSLCDRRCGVDRPLIEARRRPRVA